MQSLTSRELDNFLMYLRIEKNLSADTVNKTMTAGNMAFEFLIKEGLITSNPLTSVERFKVNAKKRGKPTETEMKKYTRGKSLYPHRGNCIEFYKNRQYVIERK